MRGASFPADRVDGQRSDRGQMKLCDLVYAKIAARIRSGDYPVDSRLPSENELADGLGVSRPVVREALARLRNDGIVVSRRGSGTYVQRHYEIGDTTQPSLTSIADMRRCLEFRISLEGEAAWHAAQGRSADRDALHRAIEDMERDHAIGALDVEHDFAFHHAVALATGNRFFAEVMVKMRGSIVTAMAITPKFIASSSDERFVRIMDEHRAVYAAIQANDADAARQAMRAHLTNATTRVFDGI